MEFLFPEDSFLSSSAEVRTSSPTEAHLPLAGPFSTSGAIIKPQFPGTQVLH